MPELTLFHLFLGFAAGALLLDHRRRLAVAGLGLVAFGVGAAAFSVNPGLGGLGDFVDRTRAAPLAPSFVQINLGLLLLGVSLVVGAALATLSEGRSRRATWGAATVLSVAAFTMWHLLPLFQSLGLAVLAAALAILAAAVVLYWIARLARVARAVIWLEERILAGPRTAQQPLLANAPGRVLAGVCAVASLVALFAPTLDAVLFGATVAALSGHWAARRADAVGDLPLLPLLALPLLPAFWLMATIAGPLGLSIDTLIGGPYSPAAQTLLVPPLVVAAWGLIGLWPVHGRVPGVLLAPAGAAVLARVAVPLLPDGVLHWQPLFVPLIMIGVWHAVAVRRVPLVLTSLATLGMLSGTMIGVAGGAWLVAVAVLLAAVKWSAVRGRPVPRAVERVVWIAGAWGTLLAVAGSLQAEVVYTVFVAAGVASGVWSLREPPSSSPLRQSERPHSPGTV